MDKADGNVPNGRRYSVSPFRLFSVYSLSLISNLFFKSVLKNLFHDKKILYQHIFSFHLKLHGEDNLKSIFVMSKLLNLKISSSNLNGLNCFVAKTFYRK